MTLTAEAIEQMDGLALCRAVAEHVMGWKEVTLGCDARDGRYCVSVDGEVLLLNRHGVLLPWRPDRYIATAWQALELFLDRSPRLDYEAFHPTNSKWSAKFYETTGSDFMVSMTIVARGPTAPLAICRAVLLATLEDKEDDRG